MNNTRNNCSCFDLLGKPAQSVLGKIISACTIRPVFDDSLGSKFINFEQCLMSGVQSQFFPMILGKQHDTGTQYLLTTLSRRHPISECNKGNRRRLHAGHETLVESLRTFTHDSMSFCVSCKEGAIIRGGHFIAATNNM